MLLILRVVQRLYCQPELRMLSPVQLCKNVFTSFRYINKKVLLSYNQVLELKKVSDDVCLVRHRLSLS